MSALEVKTSRDLAWDVATGARVDVVRVQWRHEGKRRWQSFLLIPDEGQSLEELEAHAAAAAEKIVAGEVRRG